MNPVSFCEPLKVHHYQTLLRLAPVPRGVAILLSPRICALDYRLKRLWGNSFVR
jgi:hypothetical protein